MMRASGLSRRALRIACRAWRTASAVTAQLLITMVSVEAGRAGMLRHRLAFIGIETAAEIDDPWLVHRRLCFSLRAAASSPRCRRHLHSPTAKAQSSKCDRRFRAIRSEGYRPATRHGHVRPSAPCARSQRPPHRPRSRRRGSALRRAPRPPAGYGVASQDLRQRNIDAFGKQRIVLDARADRGQIVASASATKKMQCGFPTFTTLGP